MTDGPNEKVDAGRFQLLDPNAPFEEGFGWKTVWAMLFTGFVMLPGTIYMGLMTGRVIGGAESWVLIILFIEIAKRAFIKMKTQEIMILYWVAGSLTVIGGVLGTAAVFFGGPFGGMIWDQYLIQSPQAAAIAEHIPRWKMPPKDSPAFLARTFMHADWVKPIMVFFVATFCLTVTRISLGYVMFRITSDVEKLPFPLAPVAAGGATALAETSQKREGWRWRVFSIGSIIGLLFGTLYIGVPAITGVILIKPVQISPIPFADFTPTVKNVLPATPLALAVSLGPVLAGFVLPFWVLVGGFCSNMFMTFIGYPLVLYRLGILTNWSPGMGYIPTVVCNSLNFTLSFSIGLAVVVAVLGLSNAIRAARGAKKSGDLRGLSLENLPKGRGDIRISAAIGIWLASLSLQTGLVVFLFRNDPWVWWILGICLFFGGLWTPFFSYINARMIGITGGTGQVNFPYVREASFYLSGYEGVALWFAPIPMTNVGRFASTFKQLELTRTKFGSYVKMIAVGFILMWICSFLFWSLIWKLGPVPSEAYPYVQKIWPLNATFQALWAQSTMADKGITILGEIIKPGFILTGFVAGSALYAILHIVGGPTIFFYGVIAGLGMSGFWSAPQFLGALLGRYYFTKKFGKERWRSYAPVLLAGYGCGFGLVGMLCVGIALIAKSVSTTLF